MEKDKKIFLYTESIQDEIALLDSEIDDNSEKRLIQFWEKYSKEIFSTLELYRIQWEFFENHSLDIEISREEEKEILRKRKETNPLLRTIKIYIDWEKVEIDAANINLTH